MEKLDLSCGVIPVRRGADGNQVLFCRSKRYGYYLVPKGHMDPGETEIQSAVRELWEESGCRPVRFWTGTGWSEDLQLAAQLPVLEYVYQSRSGSVRKMVKLYIAEVRQEGEIQDTDECESVEWFPVSEKTAQLLHFQENIQHFIQFALPNI